MNMFSRLPDCAAAVPSDSQVTSEGWKLSKEKESLPAWRINGNEGGWGEDSLQKAYLNRTKSFGAEGSTMPRGSEEATP